MCESTAYIVKDGREELFLESVDFLEDKDGLVRLVNIFGEEKTIRAKVKCLSLVDHKIVMEPVE